MARQKKQSIDAAWQLRLEYEVGSLRSGKYADLVVLDADPYAVTPRDIADIELMGTMLGGEFTHRDGL